MLLLSQIFADFLRGPILWERKNHYENLSVFFSLLWHCPLLEKIWKFWGEAPLRPTFLPSLIESIWKVGYEKTCIGVFFLRCSAIIPWGKGWIKHFLDTKRYQGLKSKELFHPRDVWHSPHSCGDLPPQTSIPHCNPAKFAESIP